MRIAYGRGGWVEVTDPDLPDVFLYVRLQRGERGRWQTSEMYLDTRGGVASTELLRRIPKVVAAVESAIDWREIEPSANAPAIDLSRLASYFNDTFAKPGNWVADSFLAQVKDSGVKQVRHKAPKRNRPPVDVTFRLRPLDGDRTELTDAFLRDIARAYLAAAARREPPNRALAAQTRRPEKSVQRWVAEARRRGLMQPARKQGARL